VHAVGADRADAAALGIKSELPGFASPCRDHRIVEMVLAGSINKQLAATYEAAQGGRAVARRHM